MAVTVADLMVRFAADTANADAGFSHVNQQIGRFQAANNAAFSSLRGVGTAALGVVGGGLLALGGGMVGTAASGLSLNSTMENVTAQLNAFTKDGAKSAEILEMIRVRAAKTPFEFNEMAAAAAGLLPASKASGQGLESLIEKAEILAASNPAEGLEGAAFALREAVSGDFTSIIERFNLPRAYINQLKAEGVPALEIVSRAMQEVGFDTDLVSNLAETAAGRWSTFKDTFQTFAATITKPIFDKFSAGLGTVNAWLSANEPLLNRVAESISNALGGAIDSLLGMLPDTETMLTLLTEGFITLVDGAANLAQWFGSLIAAIAPFARAVASFLAPIASAIARFVSWQDVMVALGIAVASVVIPAIAGFVAAMAPIIATIGAVIAAVALLRNAWEADFLGIRTIVLTLTSAISDLVSGSDFSAFVGRVWDAFTNIGQAISGFFSGDVSLGGLAGAVAAGFGEIVAALAGFFGGGDWSGFLEAIRWDDFISLLTWENFVAALDWLGYVGVLLWTDYIAPLLWDGWLTILSWADWITSLDWASIITTALDWATWIPALYWTALIAELEWGAYLIALAWDAFVGVLDWATAVGDGITWSDFVAALDWVSYVTSVTWDSFISKLEWTGAIDKMSNWGDYISSIDWTQFIVESLRWSLYIVALSWNLFVSAIEWADWLISLSWDDYADALSWDDYAQSFEWDTYIDAVAWADWIDSALSWADYVLSLVWGDFVSQLDWPDVSFSWSRFVSKLTWPSISWPGWGAFISAFPGWPDISGIVSSLVPSWLGGSDTSGGEETKIRLHGGVAATLTQEFNNLTSKMGSVISGALSNLGGVNVDSLLPRQDDVNEDARRLASIALDGFSSPWVDYFKNQFPDLWSEITASGDIRGNAAQILKDFQDGLRPELLDKDKAKELVKRMLLGEQNVSNLINEISSELASEMGIPISQVRDAAANALGGSGALDLTQILPKDEGLSEAAARLAEIALNGYNDEWERYFRRFPEIFRQLQESGDIQSTAAQMLQDFQDGLRPELIDKERAKELVRRAFLGGQNAKALIAEVAAELSAEMGVPLEEIQQVAQSTLGSNLFSIDTSQIGEAMSLARSAVSDLATWLGDIRLPNPLDGLTLPEWMKGDARPVSGSGRSLALPEKADSGFSVATIASAIAEAMRGQPLTVNLAFSATISGEMDAERVSYQMARRISDIIQRRAT